MEEIRDNLEKINLKVYRVSNLLKLLEDYFYEPFNKNEFHKNQSLCDVIVKQIEDIDTNIQELCKKIF